MTPIYAPAWNEFVQEIGPDAVSEDKKEHFTSYGENAIRTVNTLAAMRCFLDTYAPPPDDKYFSVLLHSRLKDLKKVYIVECGADTLRDDSRLMKGALEEVGVPIMYDDYPGYPHYFWSYPSPVLAKASEEFYMNMFLYIEEMPHAHDQPDTVDTYLVTRILYPQSHAGTFGMMTKKTGTGIVVDTMIPAL
ncbi:hypothetical protein N7449_001449 [Penicillium cf. viridicatum]|uniref:Alpha/beta hydrolase fold-3 domain-containing protein n=1 Tax=Penicillium cf. viridicatum TaxID=2972119 RepID=A0A9W9TAA0_9EURO|nr:hypothetical protein N7449_001449 [Penicillium cf. viridicatum]